VGRMAELTQLLSVWDLHPQITVSDTFSLADAEGAYRRADTDAAGKVAITME
jgi:threonine dehydrogenase-like Zn-dependent dehydrogenase